MLLIFLLIICVFFDALDPRLQDYGVPVSVHGAIVFNRSLGPKGRFHKAKRLKAFSIPQGEA